MEELASFLKNQKVVLLIDEFDAIPQAALKGFLRSLRRIYLFDRTRCPHSVGIVGYQEPHSTQLRQVYLPFQHPAGVPFAQLYLGKQVGRTL